MWSQGQSVCGRKNNFLFKYRVYSVLVHPNNFCFPACSNVCQFFVPSRKTMSFHFVVIYSATIMTAGTETLFGHSELQNCLFSLSLSLALWLSNKQCDTRQRCLCWRFLDFLAIHYTRDYVPKKNNWWESPSWNHPRNLSGTHPFSLRLSNHKNSFFFLSRIDFSQDNEMCNRLSFHLDTLKVGRIRLTLKRKKICIRFFM